MKKIVVAGCRDYNNYTEAKEFIEQCISKIKKEHTLIFLSGGCRGADKLGERFAEENGYKLIRYEANLDELGSSAGPIRNYEMAQACDCVICFWDGKSKGTKSMIEFANSFKKPIRIKNIKN